LFLCMAIPSFAQTTTTSTTLSAAITAPTNGNPRGSSFLITVASATGIQSTYPASGLYIDLEYFAVTAVSGTSITVKGGQAGTVQATHPSGAKVWIGPQGQTGPFFSGPGNSRPIQGGSCTANANLYLPLINVLTGQIYNCVGSLWQTTINAQAQSAFVRRAVVNAAYTALITDQLIAYTSLSATRAVTLPSPSGFPGKIMIFKDESGSATTAGTLTITLVGTVDGSSTPTIINSAYGAYRIYSDGTNWFSW
jgi:hypothetical protein